ncbi:hypothetical protein J2S74_002978 [Evansella vedderi]|uniref:Uncharacterized protein n=1 Tax=Evansella vedderi TaxID=38282 RepID=A0ABT9ZY27_9BACI|nr:hypothetical protein [Evansella vedderi]MDQ0255596.1 hypothetical protein [Evansella vedderi]
MTNQVSGNINDTRSNIIMTLLKLYKLYEAMDRDIELENEKYRLYFRTGKGLSIEGAAGSIHVSGYNYVSVTLGEQITSYNHLPYRWLKELLNEQQ